MFDSVSGAAAAAANGEAGEDYRRLAEELDEAEQELWRQLRRKRDFEGRVAEKRAQLAELRERRRSVSTAHAEALASVEHLNSEVLFAQEQEKEIEHDVAVLKESNRILHQAFLQQQLQQRGDLAPNIPKAQVDRDVREILVEERKRQEAVQLMHDQIAHLRAHLEKLRVEKQNLLQRQQALFDKQRSAEQDRNRLLGHLQDDRSSINDVRQERIKLWEQRATMEQEMGQLVREAHLKSLGANGAAGPVPLLPPQPPSIPGAAGGVRGHVKLDTPQSFADAKAGGGNAPWGAPAVRPDDVPARPHWTGFGEAFGGGSRGSPGLGPPPSFGDMK